MIKLNKISKINPDEEYLTEEELRAIEDEENSPDDPEYIEAFFGDNGTVTNIPEDTEDVSANQENPDDQTEKADDSTETTETTGNSVSETAENVSSESTEASNSEASGDKANDKSETSKTNQNSGSNTTKNTTVDKTRVISPEDVKFNPLDDATVTGKHLVNILLIGQDRYLWESTRQRSDAMILLTINKDKKTATLTSFARDIWVQIPGYKPNRLNVPFRYGGMKLLDKTLEKNFGVKVDANVLVDFGQFTKIIDKLGGVDIEITEAEAKVLSLPEAGMVHLNGSKALSYVRERHIDSELKRTERQRNVLMAVYNKFKDSSLADLYSLLDELLPMVSTDLSNLEILGYAAELAPIYKEFSVATQRIPINKSYEYVMIEGKAVTVIDFEKNQKFLVETLTN